MTALLHSLQLPDDLKHLSINELDQLSDEIRQELLEIGKACGGHLASNLGVVELTLALHTVFESPKDVMVWDTSHQTYVHKMLTGRLDNMFTIRQDGGLCGFSNIFESDHDAFGAGHASTALSAALGLAHARDLKQETNNVISIIGDASLSGGMSFEALNNIERLKSNFIVILNDNNMSISKPVGNMAEYMTKIRTSSSYDQAKKQFERILDKIPKIGVPLKRRVEKLVDRLRDVVLDVKAGVLFEEFGFKYLGPINGHHIPSLMAALKYAKKFPGPIMIHIDTTKGKGHLPAEQDPIQFHGIAPQLKVNAQTVVSTPVPTLPTYTKVFGKSITELGHLHKDMVVITPAMKEGSGLNEFSQTFPNRFFDVGIAEEHAVTFAAGLSRAGIKPVLAIYSTFLQRGFDQLIHDVCLQKLPVIFALDRAGFVGEDGPTHHGIFDMAFMLPVPNLTILAPKDGDELTAMMHWALTQPQAVSIRYPKGSIPEENGRINTPIHQNIEVLFDSRLSQDLDIPCLIIAVGSMVWPAYQAAERLKETGVHCVVINLRFVKPLDIAGLTPFIAKAQAILTIEEGSIIGGAGQHVQTQFSAEFPEKKWEIMGIGDEFVDHGKVSTQRQHFKLNSKGIEARIVSLLATYQHV